MRQHCRGISPGGVEPYSGKRLTSRANEPKRLLCPCKNPAIAGIGGRYVA